MRVIVSPKSGIVHVNGLGYDGIDMSSVDPSINAIHWDGEVGDIEYRDITQIDRLVIIKNESITDFSQFQHLVDAWQFKHENIDSIRQQEKDAEAQRVALMFKAQYEKDVADGKIPAQKS